MSSKAKLPVQIEEHRILNIQGDQEKVTIEAGALELMSHSSREYNLASLNNPSEILDVVQLYLKQAQLYLIQNNYEKAILACKEALRVSPDTAEAYKIWGNVLQVKGLSADAMGAYAKALLICPTFSEMYANLGSLYANQKQWQLAREYYQKAIAANPKFAGAYRNLAKVQAKLNKPHKQAECLINALRLNPTLGTAEEHYQLANTLLNQDRTEEAAQFFRNAVELKPDFVAAYDMLAHLLEQQGDWKAAVACYRQVLDLKTAKDHNNSSQQLLSPKKQPQLLRSSNSHVLPADISEGQMEASNVSKLVSVSTEENIHSSNSENLSVKIQSLLEIARHQRDSEIVHVKLGDLYAQINKWEKSIYFYRTALSINPKMTEAYHHLGKVYSKIGQRVEAAECWYRAFSLEPQLATAKQHYYLANALAEQGKIEKAAICYRTAIKYKSDFTDALYKLANIFLSKGDNAEAKSIYLKILKLYPDNLLIKKKINEITTKTTHSPLEMTLKTKVDVKEKSDKQQKNQIINDDLILDQSTTSISSKIESQNSDSQQIYLAAEEHNRGEQLSKSENWDQAILAFRKAIELNPNFSWSHHNLGQCYHNLGKWFSASLAYQDAIKLRPDFIWTYYNLGEVLEQLNCWDEAMAAYSEAAKIDEKLAKVHARIAYLHSLKGDLKPALMAYQHAQELQPDLKWIEGCVNSLIYNLGVKSLSIGALDEAEKYFQQVQLVQVSQIPPKWFVDRDRRWPWYQYSFASAVEGRKQNNIDWPKISIVTPSLNQGKFIEETILSVLNQGYTNLEYILVDGESTDETLEILRRYSDKIDFLLIESDTGQSNAINKGLNLANGEILSWLNSDDMLAPGALHRVALEYLSSQSDVIAGICTVHRQYEVELIRKPNIQEDDFTVERLLDVEKTWESGDCFFQPEIFFSRNIWELSGAALDENLHYVMDHEMWIRFAKAGATLKILHWPVGLFRKHDAQKTANEKGMLDELMQVTKDPRWNDTPRQTSDYQYDQSDLNRQLKDSHEENEFLRFELAQVKKELDIYLSKNHKKERLFKSLEGLSQQAIHLSQIDTYQE